jgi:hypothetical protein
LFGFIDINDVLNSPGVCFTGIIENLLSSSKEPSLIIGNAVKKF